MNRPPHAAAPPLDQRTAQAFANSWNHLPAGSVYTREQFEDWFVPLSREDVVGRSVLELGCGNGSLLVHLLGWEPAALEGVDLGDSVRSAEANLRAAGKDSSRCRVTRGDLVARRPPAGDPGADLVYCIGVLHHLQNPEAGFASVLANTRPGGRFHCWVYGHEGNAVVRLFVEPLRRVLSRCPWWFTKHVAATALAAPVFLYAKGLCRLPAAAAPLTTGLPLADYCRWIGKREFAFVRHVVFDQLVTPQTVYLRRETLEGWLRMHGAEIVPGSAYVIQRNGNSWKFGGVRTPAKDAATPAQ